MEWNTEDAQRIAFICLSKHAAERMAEMHMTPNQIFAAIAKPDQTWELNKSNAYGQALVEVTYRRDDIQVVMDKRNRIVMTVLLRSKRRFVRGVHHLGNLPDEKPTDSQVEANLA